MTAYVIANVDVFDPERYEEYRRRVPATIAAFGGRYLARGGRVEVMEGEWSPERLVIVEFESFERAQAWLSSEEYAPLKAIRESSAHADLVITEGVEQASAIQRR